MYGIRQCNRIFLCGEIGAFFTEIFFQISFSVVILNSNLHYQIFKFVIDNSDISLNCLQHIQKRRNFDAKVTYHQPICLLLHAILRLKWSRSECHVRNKLTWTEQCDITTFYMDWGIQGKWSWSQQSLQRQSQRRSAAQLTRHAQLQTFKFQLKFNFNFKFKHSFNFKAAKHWSGS